MAFIKTVDNINMNSKVLAAGVIDANSSAQWFESRFNYEMVVSSTKIWNEMTRLKTLPAATLLDARANAALNTDLIQDLSSTGIKFTVVPGTDGTTFAAYTVPGNTSSARLDNWIQPQQIPQVSSAPSNGYMVQVYIGGDSTTGTPLYDIDGMTGSGADASVSWFFNYSMGILMFAPDSKPASNEIWVYGFRYVGETGGAGSAQVNDYAQIYDIKRTSGIVDSALNITRNLVDLNDPGVTKIQTEESVIELYIAWERPTKEGLGYNSSRPTINGNEIDPLLITSSPFDKVQTATYIHTIAPLEDIILTYNGQNLTVVVEQVTKPTFTLSVVYPDLPWAIGVSKQTSLKQGDLYDTVINNVSEDIDAYELIGGDHSVYVIDANTQTIDSILSSGSKTVPTTVTCDQTGTRKVAARIKATATQAWSDIVEIDVVIDNVDLTITTYDVTYPSSQLAVKESESVSVSAITSGYDDISFVGLSNPDLIVNPSDFTFNQGTSTFNISALVTPSVLTTTYRYDNVAAYQIQLRKVNGMEATFDLGAYISNVAPQVVQPVEPTIVRAFEPKSVTLTFDQPIVSLVSASSASSSSIIIQPTTNQPVVTIDVTRDPLTVPVIEDVSLVGVVGPSGLSADLTVINSVKMNGFSLQTIAIPPAIRQGTIPVYSDIAIFNTEFSASWDATDLNNILVPEFTDGGVSADKLIYLELTPTGINFKINYSDTTIIETTLRIEQAG